MVFAKTLRHWYLQNKRDLPWRNSTDPYPIWLSEIILQQTRVAQGLPYFEAFIATFPTVCDLAAASEQQVLKLWQGLGYYSRARNLHKTAQIVALEHNGVFPNNYQGLLKLPGIGDYTAAAIASFAYGERVPVVDGNVFRVLSRYIGIENNIADTKSRAVFQQAALELMQPIAVEVFNQAIMEFGALQCVPKNPDCGACPFNGSCFALKFNKVATLPIKTKKPKSVDRYFDYLVFDDALGQTLVLQRTGSGIWQNLYEFPLLYANEKPTEHAVLAQIQNQTFVDNQVIEIRHLNQFSQIHKLTHQNLHLQFWKVSVDGVLQNGKPLDQTKNFPFPIVLERFIEKYTNK